MTLAASHDGPRLLVFNCHEGWIAQLDGLPYALDLVIGLPGRPAQGWDERARPIPAGARLLTLDDVRRLGASYDCVILHGAADLLAARNIAGPRLLVAHHTLEGRIEEEPGAVDLAQLRQAILTLLRRTATHAVAVSPMKARSWGLEPSSLLAPGVDPSAFGPYDGGQRAGIRVVNHLHQRQRILRWDLHAAAFRGLPLTLVGHNPGMLGSTPARSFGHLKDLLRVHRFYVHTVDPLLEDGYNLAVLEAMASGLPVVGTCHPSSPVRHGVDGFLSDEPDELRAFAERLLGDRPLAAAMGASARARVAAIFSRSTFVEAFARAVATAQHLATASAVTRGGILA